MDFIRSKKTTLIDILSSEATFILQRVQRENLITQREYGILKSMPNGEKTTIELLDKMMSKNDDYCKRFISMLGTSEVVDTFPALEVLLNPQGNAPRQEVAQLPATDIVQQRSIPAKEYTMKSKPRGTCVIFNNVNFDGRPKSKREGSDQDADNLEKTFGWLGFDVEILKDSTVQEMNVKLEELRNKVTGDCFICCVLSHGDEAGVKGCDNAGLKIRDIYSPFSGTRCPALKGKPKVFFIQACRGSEMQAKVNIQADSMDEQQVETESDVIRVDLSTADFADFLIAMSTFEGHYSIRDTRSGSWFIQSLCEHLKKPSQDHILDILTEVNEAVSAKEGYDRKLQMEVKQIPAPMFTLTKKLFFPVPE